MFSVPLNPKLNPSQFNQFAQFLSDHKHLIYDVYFTSRIPPFTQDAMGDIFVNDAGDLIENALIVQEQLGIPISATFNNIQVRPSQDNLDLWIENFTPLYEKGIHSATIPHTHWVMTGQIQHRFPKLKIKNTILREVNTASDVAKQAEAGFYYINIDRDLIRNRDELIKIGKVRKKYRIHIALLANEGCLGGCPVMAEHFQFNNTRTTGPRYFTDVISRVSCSQWDIKEPATALKSANIAPWREDWVELLQYVDVFKMHGRESMDQLASSMDIIHRYSNSEDILSDEFNDYIKLKHLEDKPINAWRQFIKNCKFDCWDCNKCDDLYKAKNETRIPDKRDVIIDSLCIAYLD